MPGDDGTSGLPVTGDDGRARCPWGDAPADLRRYHDEEWGRPLHGDRAWFERLSLEAYQSGLSWLTVLRRRDALRAALGGLDPVVVADLDVEQVLAAPGTIRNRAKTVAVVANARTLLAWQRAEGEGCLDALVRSAAPVTAPPAPRSAADVPASTPAAAALAAALRSRGWRFVGPVTAHATLQAGGLVDDHLAGCWARGSGDPGQARSGQFGCRVPPGAGSTG